MTLKIEVLRTIQDQSYVYTFGRRSNVDSDNPEVFQKFVDVGKPKCFPFIISLCWFELLGST